MEIFRLNHSILVKTKKEQILIGNDLSKEKQPKCRIYIETITSEKIPNNDDKVIISGPGEYEVGGVEIIGYRLEGEGLIYLMTVDEIKIAILGGLSEMPSDKKMERLGEADIMVKDWVNTGKDQEKLILDLAKKMGINYLVPFGYDNQTSLEELLDATDSEGKEEMESLKIERDDLPDGLEVVLLKSN